MYVVGEYTPAAVCAPIDHLNTVTTPETVHEYLKIVRTLMISIDQLRWPQI
jgi:hypothetical protein